MTTRIAMSTGPGQGVEVIADALTRAGALTQILSSNPRLSVINVSPTGERTERVIRSFGILQHATWAAWSRLPYYKQFQTPSGYLLPLADKILSNHLEPCELFIGWQRVALNCMRTARDRFGARVVLEHQTANVHTWMDLVTEEYKRWGGGASGFYSLFSDRQIARMEAEYEEADVIHLLSSYARDSFLANGFDARKLVVTPFGVDTDLFRPAPEKSKSSKLRLLYVGRLELLKGLQYLLEAFKRIRSRDVELHLVGPVLDEIKPVLARFADDRIKVLGSVAREELPHHYQSSDVFMFPSVNDAFGLVVLEAMACGVPVITTENSCGHDVVTDGEDGFVAPIRDADAIRKGIEFFLDCREEMKSMGRLARIKVESDFTAVHYRRRYLEAFA